MVHDLSWPLIPGIMLTLADLFMTDRHDKSINQTSSYLDLSPLYGNNQEEQNYMRTFQDGKVKADCFSNKRVLGFPPGIGLTPGLRSLFGL